MPGSRIVVVGGGFGGAAAARAARALLGAEHEVTLVDRNPRTYLCGGLPLLIIGERHAADLARSPGSLAKRGVRCLQAEVTGIDLGKRRLEAGDAALPYDFLILAPGARYDWDAVPGAGAAYSFYDLETARRLRRRLAGFKEGRVVIGVASLPYKCPPAPFEAAMTLDWSFRRRGLRARVQIDLFTPELAPLKVAGPDATDRLKADLADRAITLHAGVGVKAVSDSGHEVSLSDGSSVQADLVITIPVHRAPSLVRDAGLVNESGWAPVNAATLQTALPNVFVIGDANLVLMANGMSLPKAGVFASAEGETVAHNIAAEIIGGEPAVFDGAGYCFIATGGEAAGTVEGKFLAEGKPDVHLEPATPSGMERKAQFERDWRRFRI